MGKIDASELLADPDFLDSMVLIHREAHVNERGENKLREQGFQVFGTVQPASGKTLQRLPEALRVASVMSFWIKGKIVSDGNCQYPDIINFRGVRYAVQVVFDWTMWGDGFSEGTCVREKAAL
jgi:hypothetical protein